jgi:hypothetical protein
MICLGFALLFFKPSCPGAEEAQAAAKEEKKSESTDDGWQKLFDGKTLEGWKSSDFIGQGKIEVKDGQLIIGWGEGCSGVTYTKDFPKIDFEVELEAQRLDGSDFFASITFPIHDQFATLVVGGWGGGVIGISCIDGMDASENATTTYRPFEQKTWYKVRLQVTDEHGIKAWIDGKEMVEHPIKGYKFSLRWEIEESKPFGIASWNSTAALKNIRMKRVKSGE